MVKTIPDACWCNSGNKAQATECHNKGSLGCHFEKQTSMKLKDKQALKQQLAHRTESPEQQRKRIADLLANEVIDYTKAGIPNEVLGLKVYNALIDARIAVENLQTLANRLALQLGIEVEKFIEDAKTSKSG